MSFELVLGRSRLRSGIGAFGRLTRTADSATCTLIAGFAVLVFAFLPGFPYRLEQYDLPKDVALGVLGSISAIHLLVAPDSARADRLAVTLVAFLSWGLITALLVSDNGVLALRTVGLFAAVAAVFLLAHRTGRAGASAVVAGGTLVIIGLMCAVVLLEAFGGIPFLSAPGRRPGATLGNRNLAARLACMALPLLWVRLLVVDRPAAKHSLLVGYRA